MAGTAHWVKVSGSGTRGPGTNQPTLTATIPARGTVQRIVHHLIIGGVGTSTGALGYQSIQPVYVLKTIDTVDKVGAAHRLHYSNYMIPLAVTAMFDSTQLPPPGGQNRLFYGYYQAGDKEVGDNIKTSWGGPLMSFAYNITLVAGVFFYGANGNPFTYDYTSQLHVLYYS